MKISVVYSMPTRRAIASDFVDTDTDTQASAEKVAHALRSKGASVVLVPITEDTIESSIQKIRADMVFNLVEWTGLDLPLSLRVLDVLVARGLPYTGATKENFALTSDKVAMKHAFDEAELPTAQWEVFEVPQQPVRPDFHYPVIAKPSLEHCSVGLTKDAIGRTAGDVTRIVTADLKKFEQPILVEEFIDGPEYHVTLYQKKGKVVMLPPAQITFDGKGLDAFLTFNSRWKETDPEFQKSHISDPDISEKALDALTRVCIATFKKLKFRDYARMDIRMKGTDVYILEANSNPGLDDDPDYEMSISFALAGMPFTEFIWAIVQSALYRYETSTIAVGRGRYS